MGFTKITAEVKNISALPDKVNDQAQTLKRTFDQAGADIKEAFNTLIDELESKESAGYLGTKNPSGEASTVQDVLDTLYTSLTGKVEKVEGKGLSTEDYTSEEKDKLAGIAEGANKYVLPEASTSTLGGVKPDGTTTVVENGVLKAVASESADYTAREAVENLQTDFEEFQEKNIVKVLEASTTNVIDFDTLKEPGIYFVKGCNDTAGVTLNSGVTSSYTTTSFDVMLEVRRTVETAGTTISQKTTIQAEARSRQRTFSAVSNTWSNWTFALISAGYISGGTLAGTVKANSAAAATLGNTQLRDIFAGTSDMTAGTSSLVTGTIYLQYE